IGSIGCRIRGDAADFGFLLNRRYWRLGYATEAAGAVLEWLKSLDVVRHIHATCDIENLSSARVLEKLGLRQAARLPGYAVRANMPGAPKAGRVPVFLESTVSDPTPESPDEDFATLFAASTQTKRLAPGQTVTGTIVAIGADVALVNVG